MGWGVVEATRRWDGGQCHVTSPWEHAENWRILEVSEIQGRVHGNQAAEPCCVSGAKPTSQNLSIILGSGFKDFLFSPLFGEMIQFD